MADIFNVKKFKIGNTMQLLHRKDCVFNKNVPSVSVQTFIVITVYSFSFRKRENKEKLFKIKIEIHLGVSFPS